MIQRDSLVVGMIDSNSVGSCFFDAVGRDMSVSQGQTLCGKIIFLRGGSYRNSYIAHKWAIPTKRIILGKEILASVPIKFTFSHKPTIFNTLS